MRTYWGRNIRDLWFSAGVLILTAGPAASQTLDGLVRNYAARPGAPAKAALERFAEQQSGIDSGLALLGLGFVELGAQSPSEALKHFTAARLRAARLADFADWGAAKALIALDRKQEAVPVLLRVAMASAPVSPFRSPAVLQAVAFLMERQEYEQAAALLRQHMPALPPAEAQFAYGRALEQLGRGREAALTLQTVFHEYPKSEQARLAEVILQRLQGTLGADYPEPTPKAILSRAAKLGEARDGRRAGQELAAALSALSGPDRDYALVRIGTARFQAADFDSALDYLKSLSVGHSDADAERLFFIVQSARRLDRWNEVDEAVEQLGRSHRHSPWRLRALTSAANRFLVNNEPHNYEPLYRACFTDFPAHAEAGDCHWKVTWQQYLRRSSGAEVMLKAQVERFPKSEETPAAIYYLGRISERRGDFAEAQAYYEVLTSRFPNYYYAVVSRERLAEVRSKAAAPSPAVGAFLMACDLPRSSIGADFGMDEITRLRLDRARLLVRAALDDWAEQELRFGAATGAKRTLIGIDLAQMLNRRGAHEQALRIIKAYGTGYLSWHFEDAPEAFWKLAFPLPYRNSVDRYSSANSLDRNVVAGLIRQESEFDPKAVSYANAIGLTQIRPPTGRELGRKLGIRSFKTSMLYEPDTNLRLGTYYLRRVLDGVNGLWVAALAGYNAGPSRTAGWLRWRDFNDSEPSEFIETIPLEQTHHYVQAVLRNADVYRRLYGEGNTQLTSSSGPETRPRAVPASTGRKPAAAKSRAASRATKPRSDSPAVRTARRNTKRPRAVSQ
jgi:soluble lytic murein transglycosylase